MKKALFAAAALGSLLGLTGCGFDFELRVDTAAPIPAVVSPLMIQISEGVAVAVTVLDGDKPIDESTEVSFRPDDAVIGIEPTLQTGRFVFFGIKPGKTKIHVTIDGEEREMEAVVVAQ